MSDVKTQEKVVERGKVAIKKLRRMWPLMSLYMKIVKILMSATKPSDVVVALRKEREIDGNMKQATPHKTVVTDTLEKVVRLMVMAAGERRALTKVELERLENLKAKRVWTADDKAYIMSLAER